MSKAKLNYIVDVIIGLGFILASLSGLISFFAPSGYQGGRNPYYQQPVLFLTTHTWNVLHTWSSMAMIAGVGAHLVLHWEWMVCMTRKMFVTRRPGKEKAATCPIE
jgi:hypothetical protein